MIPALILGVAIWTLAFVGAGLIAGPVGLIVVAVFCVTAGALGVLSQRDLDAKYVVIKKDRDE